MIAGYNALCASIIEVDSDPTYPHTKTLIAYRLVQIERRIGSSAVKCTAPLL